ncbi:MAG: hypothetical protein E7034_02270 [Akkermansiaceae bacterium]|nr:hypothetical protein [Akkermansiaceae bacterium]
MRISTIGILPLLAILLLQSGCERRAVGQATRKASDEFSLMQEEMMRSLHNGDMSQEEAEEIDELLQHFAKTADARFATEQSGLTMLHLACLYKHAELARCLLLDGASPHATLKSEGFCGLAEPGATPLVLAVAMETDCPESEVLALTQHLLQAGARVNMQREGQLCSYESVYLALLQRAENLDDIRVPEADVALSIGKTAAENGWKQALEELFKRREGKLTPGDMLLLHSVAGNNTGEKKYTDCAELLLQKGIPANMQDINGVSPLFALMTGVSFQQDDGMSALPLAELLLQRGADINLKAENDPEYPGFSPMDFLLTKPGLLRMLREKGFDLQPPPINWAATDELPREICRAHLMEHALRLQGISPDTAEHYDTIARILTPDSAMRQHPLYADALSAGISMMAQIDAARTAQLLAGLSLWSDALVWKDQHPHALATLEVLTETPALVLPRDVICTAAETMEKENQQDMAAAMLELLGRCPDAEADIARYEQDARPAMQAGALQARLLQAGLPAAKCYAVRDWLAKHGRTADSPPLQKAVLLTSQEDIWFGNMEEAKREEVFAAMEEVGALRAAKAYRDIAASLHQAEALDTITADSHVWKFELECATARFILQHRSAFLPPSEQEKENTD